MVTLVVRVLVAVFCLLLLVVGLLPLIGPDPLATTSQAPAYAWFHLVAALVGLALVGVPRGRGAGGFALFFGLIDLYQAAASKAGWFPMQWFAWTPVDDLLHLVLGTVLVLLGALSLAFSWRKP